MEMLINCMESGTLLYSELEKDLVCTTLYH
jgi:hypothetical protein